MAIGIITKELHEPRLEVVQAQDVRTEYQEFALHFYDILSFFRGDIEHVKALDHGIGSPFKALAMNKTFLERLEEGSLTSDDKEWVDGMYQHFLAIQDNLSSLVSRSKYRAKHGHSPRLNDPSYALMQSYRTVAANHGIFSALERYAEGMEQRCLAGMKSCSRNILSLIAESMNHKDGERRESLTKMVVELSELYTPLVEKEGIIMEVSQPAIDGKVLEGYRQVFSNLLENAIKYIGEGAIKHILLNVQDTSQGYLCSVKDTGIGVDPENRLRMFNGYSTGNASYGKGQGIGLSTSKEFVESQGGTINVQSNPGQGSKFNFTIPYDMNRVQRGQDQVAHKMPA